MNPLGTLPASTSPAGTLDLTDWRKILREALLLGSSALITYAPTLAGLHYSVGGQDITPEVVIGVRIAVELVRRLVTGPLAK
jgi:hypothetical protein